MSNVAEELSREIGRVTSILEQYKKYSEAMPGANFRPAIFMLENSLEAAKKAAGMDDAIVQIRALTSLQDYKT
jgi:hypothetical protein